ncbi:MAG: hypothetical protein HC797_07515 [Anaerolineales bacterium]|nr:hypothetical protein [Anaerolineales bacterium]
MADKLTSVESFKIYEDGKHRRYQLLFGVNGGAFAIAKLFSDAEAVALLGNLTLSQLALGMLIFTVVMTADIFMFGEKMRQNYLKSLFGTQGKIVLFVIGFLICAGWFFVI